MCDTRIVVLVAALFVLAGSFTTGTVSAVQVVSPSVTGPVPVDDDDRVASELEAQATATDPTARILLSLKSMVPFELVGSDAEVPLRAAIRQFISGKGDATLAELKKLAELRPELPPSGLLVAGMFFAAGDNAQGRRWLEKSVVDHPGYPTSWTGFARLAISERRIADAQALLEKSARVMEEGTWSEDQKRLFQSEYLDGMVDVSVSRGNLAQARARLLELQPLVPDNAKIPLRLAQVDFDLNDVDASLEWLRKAREMAPEIRVSEVIIAEWYMRRQDPEESRKWMTLAAEQNPDNVNVMVDYARWLLQTEQFPEALAAIEKAREEGANSFLVQFIKGQIAFARRDFELAEMHFESLIREKPGDADATNMLALSLIENADPSKQERALQMSVVNQRMYPRSPTAAATVGWTYFRLGKLLEAENVFRQITAAKKSMDPTTAFFVASFLASRGENTPARTLLEKAVANKDYFMFRKSASELLAEVEAKATDDDGTLEPTPATSDEFEADKR